jgi:hypothetical protein
MCRTNITNFLYFLPIYFYFFYSYALLLHFSARARTLSFPVRLPGPKVYCTLLFVFVCVLTWHESLLYSRFVSSSVRIRASHRRACKQTRPGWNAKTFNRRTYTVRTNERDTRYVKNASCEQELLQIPEHCPEFLQTHFCSTLLSIVDFCLASPHARRALKIRTLLYVVFSPVCRVSPVFRVTYCFVRLLPCWPVLSNVPF